MEIENVVIREIGINELDCLEEMLYEAIYQPDEENLIPREVIKIPEVYAYIDKFGQKKGDHCFVAEINGEIIGATWTRIIADKIKGYGYIDNQTPEFAISLFKEYREMGIGTQLMYAMIEHLQKSGYKQASLSVQKENYAVRLYENIGFKILKENDSDYLMLLAIGNK